MTASPPPAARRAIEARLEAAVAAPYAEDFYGLLRALEAAQAGKPRLGLAQRPADEPVRLGQDIALTFAPAAISSVSAAAGGKPARVGVRFFGLFGPNGPLPLHLTEFAYGRALHEGDRTLGAFADVFHHRLLLLFFRAWAQARPALWLDRDDDARFDVYVGALFGLADAASWRRDAVDDAVKRRHAGVLARGVKNAEGLRDILIDYFGVGVRIETNVGQWLPISAHERTRLGAGDAGSRLGAGAVAGSQVWDRQYKFRIHIGPLAWHRYLDFLPGESCAVALRDWVRQYVGLEFAWDVAVGLRGDDVPPAALDGQSRIGLSAWLGGRRHRETHADLVYEPETRGAVVH